MSELTLVIGSL